MTCSRFPHLARLVLVAGLVLTTGCGSYVDTARLVRESTSSGDIPSALEILEKRGGDDPDVLNLMERGLLLSCEGRFEESNALLQRADARIESIYKAGLVDQALSFLTNDAKLPYLGYPHEQVMLHVYGALNYMALGDLESALVECRRVGLRLTQLEDLRGDKAGYTHDAFAEWLAGLLYAEDGDGNGAMVSARRAQAAFQEMNELWGIETPRAFLSDAILWGRRFGFDAEAEELAQRYPAAAERARPARPREGEVLLIYESGNVASLVEQRLDLPILDIDRDRKHDELAPLLYGRGYRGNLAYGIDVDDVAYWLSVAFPTLQRQPYRLTHARMSAGDRSASTQMVQDVSAIAELTFAEGDSRRAIRTIVRALVKYAVTSKIKKQDSALGFLANAVGSATERADTRSWTTLPDRIHVARLRLPQGTYPIEVQVFDEEGRVAQTATFPDVPVRSGELTLLHHRTFQ